MVSSCQGQSQGRHPHLFGRSRRTASARRAATHSFGHPSTRGPHRAPTPPGRGRPSEIDAASFHYSTRPLPPRFQRLNSNISPPSHQGTTGLLLTRTSTARPKQADARRCWMACPAERQRFSAPSPWCLVPRPAGQPGTPNFRIAQLPDCPIAGPPFHLPPRSACGMFALSGASEGWGSPPCCNRTAKDARHAKEPLVSANPAKKFSG